jgi:hypothetical protein
VLVLGHLGQGALAKAATPSASARS